MDLYLIGSFLSFWTDPQNLISFGKAAFGLGLVIFVHELGHFLVAKACGVKCEKFYVGFDVPIQLGPIKLPASLFKKQVGETEYGLGIIPLGGYVKMLGQDDNPGAAAEENERIRVKTTNAAGEEEYQLDPRSYPAKTVPQRMAIISAGVVMNLIFGVLFATVAYKLGVNYLPCVIGSTVPGDPAWQAGLKPGDKVIQLGKDGEEKEDLRFSRELRYKVVETGDGNLLPIKIRRDDEEIWIDVTPSTPYKKETSGLPTIGVISGSSNVFAKLPLDTFSIAASSELTDGDRIVRASADGDSRSIESMFDLHPFLLANTGQPITLEVERKQREADETSLVSVTLPPKPMKTLGLHMEWGPVENVQANSPAAEAGIKPGDRLMAIDGQPVGDPLLVDEQLAQRVGEEVTLTFDRNGESIERAINPRPRVQFGWPLLIGSSVSIETAGFSYSVSETVAEVLEHGSAAAAGLKPGDRLLSFMLAANDSAAYKSETAKALGIGIENKFRQGAPGFITYFNDLQTKPDDLEVHVTYQRGDETKSAVLAPTEATDTYYYHRGVTTEQLSDTRTAATWSEALRLGVRETKEGIGHVVFTLRKIKDLYKSLGGPISIGAIATSEASAGIPRLLIFLTLLSANLAVLNFLPIPVLDGGHMMFLIYEGIFGKPVNERIAFGLTMVGLSFILALMVFVIGLDFWRFGGGG